MAERMSPSTRRVPRQRVGKVSEAHFLVLMNWLHANARRTYPQMADYLFEEVGHLYTPKQIFGGFKRRKISRKKINSTAMQQDEEYRREFRIRFRALPLGN